VLDFLLRNLWADVAVGVLVLIVRAFLLKLACFLRNGPPPAARTVHPSDSRPVPVPSALRAFGIAFVAELAATAIAFVLLVPISYLDLPPAVAPVLGILTAGAVILAQVSVYAGFLPTTQRQAFGVWFFQLKLTALAGVVIGLVVVAIALASPQP